MSTSTLRHFQLAHVIVQHLCLDKNPRTVRIVNLGAKSVEIFRALRAQPLADGARLRYTAVGTKKRLRKIVRERYGSEFDYRLHNLKKGWVHEWGKFEAVVCVNAFRLVSIPSVLGDDWIATRAIAQVLQLVNNACAPEGFAFLSVTRGSVPISLFRSCLNRSRVFHVVDSFSFRAPTCQIDRSLDQLGMMASITSEQLRMRVPADMLRAVLSVLLPEGASESLFILQKLRRAKQRIREEGE